jgi:hypothetical protein
MAFTTRTAMTTKRSIKWGLVAAATAFGAVAAMPGCELLVDFDRSKIPQDAADLDGTTDDVTSPVESSTPGDGGSSDGTTDAPDSPVEGSTADAPSEAAAEAGTPDTGADAPVDTGTGAEAASDSGDDGG